MNIQQLINKLCPEGVEWKTLDEVLSYEQPGKYIVHSTDYVTTGTPVLTAGATFVLGYTDETDGIYYADKNDPVIIFDDFTTSFHWVDFDFKVKSSAMKMLKPSNDEIVFRYVYYAMCSINYKPVEHSRQWIGTFSQFQIPLPPITIQNRIVEILDHFIDIRSNLISELNLRRKQLEFYRENLFAFEDDVELKKVKDIITSLKTGLNPRDNFVLNADDANCHYITGKEIQNNKIQVSDKTDLISNDVVKLINKRAQLHSNILLFASTGTGTVGRMAIVEEYKGDWNVSETLYIITPKDCVLLKFLMYALYSNCAIAQFEPKISKGSVPHLKVVDLLNVQIPLPPLSIQKTIVDKLDKFNALIDNIEQELSLRQKQYEFYREQLLTF